MHYLVEKTFQKHGFDDAFLLNIENKEHSVQDNLDRMVEELHNIYLSRRHIVLIPDFDMDGITSGTIGNAGFNELGFYFDLYMPRVEKYGFDRVDIDMIRSLYPDVSVIMTCDVGIAASSSIQYAKSFGIEFLVTDHHPGSFMNGADIVIDPSATGSTYTNVFGPSSICGAHVILQLLMAYAEKYGTYEQRCNIKRLTVLAGIGTISDVMPVICENRDIIKDSITILKWLMPSEDIIEAYVTFDNYANTMLSGYHKFGYSKAYQDTFYGIQGLMWYFKAERKMSHNDIDEDFIGFVLGPMFNSVKRLSEDIRIAFGIFFDRENSYEYIHTLNTLNQQRKQLVSEHMCLLNTIAQPFAPFLYLSDAPSGILGLMATKLLNQNGVPTMVVNRTPKSNGRLYGSGRCPDGYNLPDAILRWKLIGVSVAGHLNAFGVNVVPNEDLLSSMYMALYTDMLDFIDPSFNPVDDADFVIGSDDAADVDFNVFALDEYYTEICEYKPFGRGFFKPNLAIRITKEDMAHMTLSIMGVDSQHIKYMHEDGLEIIIWNGAGEPYFFDDGFTALGHMGYVTYKEEDSFAFIVDKIV